MKMNRSQVTVLSSLLVVELTLSPALAFALPDGGNVVAGSAVISQPGVNNLRVQQTSDKAVIDWRGFNIGASEGVNFSQPDASAVALNRVTGGDLSTINGSLTANGKIFLINPQGVVFGRGAQVNVAGQDTSRRVITTAVPFLTIAPDARAGGMGDVGAATSPDVNAQYWNIAKLAFIKNDYGFACSSPAAHLNFERDEPIIAHGGFWLRVLKKSFERRDST